MSTIDGTKLKPLADNILVVDMEFDEQITASGIVIRSDDGKAHGVKPRWALVWAIGPEQQDVQVGDWVYVEHGRWTRGVKATDDNGKEIMVRRVDPDAILLQSDEKPSDVYVGVE